MFPACPVKLYLYLIWGTLAALRGVSELNFCFLHGTWKCDKQQYALRPGSPALCLCRLLVGNFWYVIRSEWYSILCHLWGAWYRTKGVVGSKRWWSCGKWFKIWGNFSKDICSLIKNTCGFWNWPLNLRSVLLQTRGHCEEQCPDIKQGTSRSTQTFIRYYQSTSSVATFFCLKCCVPLLAPAVIRENGITCNPNSGGTDNELTHLLELYFLALPEIIKEPRG